MSVDAKDAAASSIPTPVLLKHLMGQRVVCAMKGNRTATGRLMCIDRLCNVLLSDCLVQQPIVSSDYPEHRPETKTAVSTRHLQQAVVSGEHLEGIRVCKTSDYETAVQNARQELGELSTNSTEKDESRS